MMMRKSIVGIFTCLETIIFYGSHHRNFLMYIHKQLLPYDEHLELFELTQPAFTCSKLTLETLEQSVKYVQS